MKQEQMKDKLGASLSGLTIQSFRLVAGGTLILYLGRGPSSLSDDPNSTRLWIDAAWRICTSDTVLAGSLDSPDLLLPQLQKLAGMTVVSVRLAGIPGDLAMMLDSGLTIESFTRSIRDEQWQVRRSDGMRLGLRENLELYEAMEEPG